MVAKIPSPCSIGWWGDAFHLGRAISSADITDANVKAAKDKYDVDENYIRYEWIEENGMSNYEMINRKTLDLIISYNLIKTKCKIVDINKNDPFKKIENYKIPIKKEPKKIFFEEN